jgi:hypothetical protein
MVKIRYSELPSGLHVSATKLGRRTTIYLQPGLTPAERHAALIRVRSSGRMGHGPQFHPFGMAMAIGADWIRTTTRNGATALRSHPVLLLPPLILLVSTAIVFILMSFVTLTMAPRQPQAGVIPGGVAPTRALSTSGRSASSPAGHQAGTPRSSPGANGGHGGRLPGAGSRPSPRPSTINSPTPDPSGSVGQDPTPTPTVSGSPSPDPWSPSPSPSPSASPSSSSSSGTCVQIGPLGLCVTL